MMIKIMSIGLLASLLLLVSVGTAKALPTNDNKGTNNPQVVANYQTGTHGIVGEDATHTGADLVKLNGSSGNLQQWFYGIGENGTEGDHSVWLVSNDGTCPANFILVPDAYPSWGDYLIPGADYCVKTNDYRGK